MDIEVFKGFVTPVPEDPDKINVEACKSCSNRSLPCCMCLPCYLSPDEIIDKSYQGIRNLIETGFVSLDWWEGDPRISKCKDMTNKQILHKGFFLRMRAENAPIVHPASSSWQCVLYDPSAGCALPYTYRPKGGRELLPPHCKANPGDKCNTTYDKQDCAIDWMPYHDVLKQVYKAYKDNLDGVVMTDDLRMERMLGDFLGSLTSMLGRYDDEE